jgi:hypothetical protein
MHLLKSWVFTIPNPRGGTTLYGVVSQDTNDFLSNLYSPCSFTIYDTIKSIFETLIDPWVTPYPRNPGSTLPNPPYSFHRHTSSHLIMWYIKSPLSPSKGTGFDLTLSIFMWVPRGTIIYHPKHTIFFIPIGLKFSISNRTLILHPRDKVRFCQFFILVAVLSFH